jgi:hypothetical protein
MHIGKALPAKETSESRIGPLDNARHIASIRVCCCAFFLLLFNQFACASAYADPGLQIVERVSFPAGGDLYSLTVRGTGFPQGTVVFKPETRVLLEFDDLRTMTACVKPKDKGRPEECNLTAVIDNPLEAVITGISAAFAGENARLTGPHTVTVRIVPADPTASPTASPTGVTGTPTVVAFSAVGYSTPRWTALIVTVVLLGIVVLLLRAGGRTSLPNGTPIGLLQAAFLDSDTSTYSLSKLQFYIWSFAIISGYLYLTIARSMVQGHLELADVPSNLPMLLAISVGTSVAAVGVSSLAGGKGAGNFHPSMSDFITSGGVVAPERLQHLLWSIVGAGGFLFFSYAISPATITSLPPLPDGFVSLMGVSAAGYIAGKIARGPGPNVRSVMGKFGTAGNTIDLTVDGANMDKHASFLLAAPGGQDTPVLVTPSPAPASIFDNNGNTASRLEFLAIPQPAGTIPRAVAPQKPVAEIPPAGAAPGGSNVPAPAAARWRFTIVNPDGEKAVWEFQPTWAAVDANPSSG